MVWPTLGSRTAKEQEQEQDSSGTICDNVLNFVEIGQTLEETTMRFNSVLWFLKMAAAHHLGFLQFNFLTVGAG